MVRQLQRTGGNARINRMAAATENMSHGAATVVQAKLVVNAPGDIHEQEADRVAEAATRGPRKASSVTTISRSMADTTTPLQQKTEGEQSTDGIDPGVQARILSPSSGRALPDGLRQKMEVVLETNLSDVRVHDNATDKSDADRLNAKAFTHGKDIWIGSQGSADDHKLMAHELTHVVQQTGEVRRKSADPTGMITGRMPGEDDQSDRKPTSLSAMSPHHVLSQDRPAASATPQMSHSMGHAQALDLSGGFPESPIRENVPPGSSVPAGLPVADKSLEQGPLAPHEIKPFGELPSTSASVPGSGPADSSPAEMVGAGELPSMDLSAVSQMSGPEPGPALPTAMPPAPIPMPMPSSSGPVSIQRDEGEDDGLLGGIRRQLNGVVDGLRSGWSQLTEMAGSAMEAIRGQVSGLLGELSSLAIAAMAGLEGAWSGLSQTVSRLTEGFKSLAGGAMNAVTHGLQAIGQAVMRLDANALRGAWGQLTGVIGAAEQRITQAATSLYQSITGLWQGLRSRFDGLVTSLSTRRRKSETA